MIWLTDAINKHKVAINPYYIIAVFQVPESDDPAQNAHKGKTAINLTNGSLIVEETEYDVVGRIASL
jgi:uncharacterized protein YlzI (FlbEa/FlbD family)